MIEEMEPFIRGIDMDVHRTKYQAGVQNIIEFLEENAPETGSLAIENGGYGENTFAEHFGEPVGSDITERWFENEDLGVKGKIGLVG